MGANSYISTRKTTKNSSMNKVPEFVLVYVWALSLGPK